MNQIEIPDCIALRITSKPMNYAYHGSIPPELVAAIEGALPRDAVRYTSDKDGEAPAWLFAPGAGWEARRQELQCWSSTDVEHGEGLGLHVSFTRGFFAGEFAPFTWSRNWSANPMTSLGLPVLNKADAAELLVKVAPVIDAKQTYQPPSPPAQPVPLPLLLAAGERFAFGARVPDRAETPAERLMDRGYSAVPVKKDGSAVEPERDPRGRVLGFGEGADVLPLGFTLAGLVAVRFTGEGAKGAAQAFGASIGTRHTMFGPCAALSAAHRKTGAHVLLFSRSNPHERLVAKRDHNVGTFDPHAAKFGADNFTLPVGPVSVEVMQAGVIAVNDYAWQEANPLRWNVGDLPGLDQNHVESIAEVVAAALAAQPGEPPPSRKGKALPAAA